MFTWNTTTKRQARKLWAEGASVLTIAKAIGATKGVVSGYVNRHRDQFPARETPAAFRKPDAPATPPRFETREQWLLAFVEAARPHFERVSTPLPKTVRVSVGFPSKGFRSKVIGECWSADSTKDKVCEIFIRPSLQSDASRVAGVLTHELVHAAVGHEAKHGPAFRKPAVALGLEGKMTATTEGGVWREWADPILAELGPFPGAELRGELAGGKPKQKNRYIKLVCDECQWPCRTPRANIDAHDHLACPTGCGGTLETAE